MRGILQKHAARLLGLEDPGLGFDAEGLFEPTALGNQLDERYRAVRVELVGDEDPTRIWIGLRAGIGGGNRGHPPIDLSAVPQHAEKRGCPKTSMVTRTVGVVIGASACMRMMQALESTGRAVGTAAREAFIAAFDTVFRTAAVIAGFFFAPFSAVARLICAAFCCCADKCVESAPE